MSKRKPHNPRAPRAITGGTEEERLRRARQAGFRYHGNYGGPGWTGGRYTGGEDDDMDYRVPPVDAPDAVFRWHDYHYRPGFSKAAADRIAARELWHGGGFKGRLAAIALAAQSAYRENTGDFWDEVRHGRDRRPSDYQSASASMSRALSITQESPVHGANRRGSHAAQTMSYSSQKTKNDKRVVKEQNLRFTTILPQATQFTAFPTLPPTTSMTLEPDLSALFATTTYQVSPSGEYFVPSVAGHAGGFALPHGGWYRFKAHGTTFVESVGPVGNTDYIDLYPRLNLNVGGVDVIVGQATVQNTNQNQTFWPSVNWYMDGIFYYPAPDQMWISFYSLISTSAVSVTIVIYTDNITFERLSDRTN